MDRTGRPEQVQAPALRSIIKMIDRAIENGSLNPQDRDEVIQMFISGPTTVVDNKAGGGMMNINEMIRPIGMAAGGPIPPEKPKIRPKEKPVNFKAIMAEFDTPENKAGPGEPVGIEKIIADEFAVDPRFTMKQRIKKMLGMGEDQGSASGMHPLVVFQEMYDQYRIDGGDMSFKEFFDMIQLELNKQASS
jgi:hypothetical protein